MLKKSVVSIKVASDSGSDDDLKAIASEFELLSVSRRRGASVVSSSIRRTDATLAGYHVPAAAQDIAVNPITEIISFRDMMRLSGSQQQVLLSVSAADTEAFLKWLAQSRSVQQSTDRVLGQIDNARRSKGRWDPSELDRKLHREMAARRAEDRRQQEEMAEIMAAFSGR